MKKHILFALCISLFLSSCGLLKKSSDEQKTADSAAVEALYKALEGAEDVKLKNRVYLLNKPLVISGKDGFTLDGAGCTFVMKNKDEDVLLVENSKNVNLKNFKATHIEPSGPIGCTGSVVQVRYSSEILIEKCQLNGSGIIGVTSYDTKNLKVVDNYIYNNSKYGVLFDGDCTVEIIKNRFEKNGEGGKAHVVKALNAYLSEVEQIPAGTNKAGIKMSENIFK